jgi:hypothetical protein
LIPSEVIVSSQTHISGILNEFPPNDSTSAVEEEDTMAICLSVCQVHIPQEFEEAVGTSAKEVERSDQVYQFTQKKLVIGFHNEYKMVSPVSRTLLFTEQQTTG